MTKFSSRGRKFEIRFLGMFPHSPHVIVHSVNLKEGDRLIVLKMTGKLEAVVMVEE